MQPCSHIRSCPLVEAMTPNFPKALEFLKLKYCNGENQSCSLFHRGGTARGESLIYQDIAWTRSLTEAERVGLAQEFSLQ